MNSTPSDTDTSVRIHTWGSVIGLLLVVGAWRFYQVRHLVLPAWVDSVHHTLLVRILLEQGTVPTTWGPYLPDTPFYYHFGFHASAALFARATGLLDLELGRAVLVAGQLWQVLLVLAIYLLARALHTTGEAAPTDGHEQAFIAALLVSFVSEMPAFYVSWGRYTLLAGATLLILAMAAAAARRWVFLALLIALTGITHHYAFLLLALYLFSSWLLLPPDRLPLSISGTVAIALLGPWLWRVWTFGQQWMGTEFQAVAPRLYNRGTARYMLSLLGPLHNYVLILIALIGCGLVIRALRRGVGQQRSWLPLCVWTLLLLALLGPWGIQPFRGDHAALLVFLPTVIFAAVALGRLRQPHLRWASVLVLLLWGMGSTRNIVRPDTILAHGEDVIALHWIEDHTPPESTFLIDVAPWFGLWRGVDGGWWITPLTGRRTVLPPVAYGWSKPEIIARYTSSAEQLASLYRSSPSDYCPGLLATMDEAAADYYYTRSPQPQFCPTLRAVYRSPNGIRLYQRR